MAFEMTDKWKRISSPTYRLGKSKLDTVVENCYWGTQDIVDITEQMHRLSTNSLQVFVYHRSQFSSQFTHLPWLMRKLKSSLSETSFPAWYCKYSVSCFKRNPSSEELLLKCWHAPIPFLKSHSIA